MIHPLEAPVLPQQVPRKSEHAALVIQTTGLNWNESKFLPHLRAREHRDLYTVDHKMQRCYNRQHVGI